MIALKEWRQISFSADKQKCFNQILNLAPNICSSEANTNHQIVVFFPFFFHFRENQKRKRKKNFFEDSTKKSFPSGFLWFFWSSAFSAKILIYFEFLICPKKFGPSGWSGRRRQRRYFWSEKKRWKPRFITFLRIFGGNWNVSRVCFESNNKMVVANWLKRQSWNLEVHISKQLVLWVSYITNLT